ncbi:hypothetical protein BU16DRAFT_580943 [Lophium mytilinum]|uniref:Uncharacterized protein n=1 Tax=Lophium mytilinum TaxID=390894 RepID=A0A6A6QXG7_9PEZI|nr:hypothetical protein BU16DRAFT_580943 [Lophium mytilinum]
MMLEGDLSTVGGYCHLGLDWGMLRDSMPPFEDGIAERLKVGWRTTEENAPKELSDGLEPVDENIPEGDPKEAVAVEDTSEGESVDEPDCSMDADDGEVDLKVPMLEIEKIKTDDDIAATTVVLGATPVVSKDAEVIGYIDELEDEPLWGAELDPVSRELDAMIIDGNNIEVVTAVLVTDEETWGATELVCVELYIEVLATEVLIVEEGIFEDEIGDVLELEPLVPNDIVSVVGEIAVNTSDVEVLRLGELVPTDAVSTVLSIDAEFIEDNGAELLREELPDRDAEEELVIAVLVLLMPKDDVEGVVCIGVKALLGTVLIGDTEIVEGVPLGDAVLELLVVLDERRMLDVVLRLSAEIEETAANESAGSAGEKKVFHHCPSNTSKAGATFAIQSRFSGESWKSGTN